MKTRHIKYITGLVLAAAIGLFAACTTVSFYDPVTYHNLTDLKGDMAVFFEDCTEQGASGETAFQRIDGFVISATQHQAYESGKVKNDETAQQLETLVGMISKVKDRWRQNHLHDGACVASHAPPATAGGCLSPGYCAGKWPVLATALDIAIETEQLKHRE